MLEIVRVVVDVIRWDVIDMLYLFFWRVDGFSFVKREVGLFKIEVLVVIVIGFLFINIFIRVVVVFDVFVG